MHQGKLTVPQQTLQRQIESCRVVNNNKFNLKFWQQTLTHVIETGKLTIPTQELEGGIAQKQFGCERTQLHLKTVTTLSNKEMFVHTLYKGGKLLATYKRNSHVHGFTFYDSKALHHLASRYGS